MVTWQALQTSSARAAAASVSLLRRADNQQRALDVVAHLVGHRAQEEAAGARHALVPDDEQVVVALVADFDEGRRGVSVVDARLDLDARVRVAGRFLVDDLLGPLADAGGEDRERCPRHFGQLDGPIDGLGRGRRPVGADEDPLVHGADATTRGYRPAWLTTRASSAGTTTKCGAREIRERSISSWPTTTSTTTRRPGWPATRRRPARSSPPSPAT